MPEDGDTHIPGTAGFYLTALDLADRESIEAPLDDTLCDEALAAICHAVDGVATTEDQRALLAWGTRLRLTGTDEAEVASLLAVAEDIGRKLGAQL